MNGSGRASSRMWMVLWVGLAAIVGLGLLLVALAQGAGEPVVVSPTPSEAPENPVVAQVNDVQIRYAFWAQSVLIDQVMGGLVGQTPPSPSDTLQRLINEALVLSEGPDVEEPDQEEIDAYIQEWKAQTGVSDGALTSALEAVGLTREALSFTVRRLLMTDAALQNLREAGVSEAVWIDHQREQAEIEIANRIVTSAASELEGVVPTVVAAAPTDSPSPTSVEPTPTEADSSSPEAAIPRQAPDFTLERAREGTLTLSEQLSEGPVVLIFFRMGG